MPKVTEPLTDKRIRSDIKAGKSAIRDGSVPGLGLYRVKNGYVWRFRYSYGDKRSYFSIGEYPIVSLKEAREAAREAKNLLEKGIDPNVHKKEREEALRRERERRSVATLAAEYLQIKRQNVSEARFKKNYVGTLKNYVLPFIGNRPIEEIKKEDILSIVKRVPKIRLPKETRTANKTYKAKEVLNILKDIFEFAVDNGYLEYNPASSVKLDRILPKYTERHIEALTDEEELRKLYEKILSFSDPATTRIMKFQALTLLRNGNIRNLKWRHIDWEKKTIVYPKEEMKASHSDFRLPLTPTLEEILTYFKPISGGKEHVFISLRTGKPLSENFLSLQYKKLGYQGVHAPHGWRSSFRTIAAEHYKEHGFPFEVIEAQLHHKIGDKVTQAYLRTDFLEERKRLLEWWEKFLSAKRPS